MFQQLTLGCDPELFLRDKAGAFLSAFGLIGGTKEHPVPLLNGAVQVDGMALEFNISPANNVDEFLGNITSVLQQIRTALGPDVEFDIKSTAHLTEQYMQTRCLQEVELGCDPDYNAYTGEANPKPDMNRPMRTAGGHVHVGIGENLPTGHPQFQQDMNRIVQFMDLLLGVPSVLLDPDVERRSMYGKAGALRYKSYGVEYRSLSNFWIKEERLIRWVYQQTARAVALLPEYDAWKEYLEMARDCINNSDAELAQDIINNSELVQMPEA